MRNLGLPRVGRGRCTRRVREREDAPRNSFEIDEQTFSGQHISGFHSVLSTYHPYVRTTQF